MTDEDIDEAQGVDESEDGETEESGAPLNEDGGEYSARNPSAAQPQRGGREIPRSEQGRSDESDTDGASPAFSVSIGEEPGLETDPENDLFETIRVEDGSSANGCKHGSNRLGLGLIFALFLFRNLRPAVR